MGKFLKGYEDTGIICPYCKVDINEDNVAERLEDSTVDEIINGVPTGEAWKPFDTTEEIIPHVLITCKNCVNRTEAELDDLDKERNPS